MEQACPLSKLWEFIMFKHLGEQWIRDSQCLPSCVPLDMLSSSTASAPLLFSAIHPSFQRQQWLMAAARGTHPRDWHTGGLASMQVKMVIVMMI